MPDIETLTGQDATDFKTALLTHGTAVLIERLTAPSSGAFLFTGKTFTDYGVLELSLDGITVDTDGAFLLMQFEVGGSLVTSATYRWDVYARSSGGTTDPTSSASGTYIPLILGDTVNWGIGNAAGECGNAHVEVFAPSSTTLNKMATIRSITVGASGASIPNHSGGTLYNTGALTGLKVYPSTGNIAAGRACLRGRQ